MAPFPGPISTMARPDAPRPTPPRAGGEPRRRTGWRPSDREESSGPAPGSGRTPCGEVWSGAGEDRAGRGGGRVPQGRAGRKRGEASAAPPRPARRFAPQIATFAPLQVAIGITVSLREGGEDSPSPNLSPLPVGAPNSLAGPPPGELAPDSSPAICSRRSTVPARRTPMERRSPERHRDSTGRHREVRVTGAALESGAPYCRRAGRRRSDSTPDPRSNSGVGI